MKRWIGAALGVMVLGSDAGAANLVSGKIGCRSLSDLASFLRIANQDVQRASEWVDNKQYYQQCFRLKAGFDYVVENETPNKVAQCILGKYADFCVWIVK